MPPPYLDAVQDSLLGAQVAGKERGPRRFSGAYATWDMAPESMLW